MNHKSLCIIIVIICFASLAQSQHHNVWKTLGLMKFERQFAENDGISQQAGRFIPVIEALECEVITLKGYVIPLDGKKAQTHFMFSAYPYAGCFFCGKAGPETVIEVFAKDGVSVEFSENAITLKGYFRFVNRDPNDIMFAMEEAVLVGEK